MTRRTSTGASGKIVHFSATYYNARYKSLGVFALHCMTIAEVRQLDFTFGTGQPELWYGPALLRPLGQGDGYAEARDLQLFGPISLMVYQWEGQLPAGLWTEDQERTIASNESFGSEMEMSCLWWKPTDDGGNELSVALFMLEPSFRTLGRGLTCGAFRFFSAQMGVLTADLITLADKETKTPVVTFGPVGLALFRREE